MKKCKMMSCQLIVGQPVIVHILTHNWISNLLIVFLFFRKWFVGGLYYGLFFFFLLFSFLNVFLFSFMQELEPKVKYITFLDCICNIHLLSTYHLYFSLSFSFCLYLLNHLIVKKKMTSKYKTHVNRHFRISVFEKSNC